MNKKKKKAGILPPGGNGAALSKESGMSIGNLPPPGPSAPTAPKPKQPKQHRMKDEEEAYFLELCTHVYGSTKSPLTHDDLSGIAKMLNKHFHDSKKIRTGENVWWIIKRKRASGNSGYAEDKFLVVAGSPKKPKGVSVKAPQADQDDSRKQKRGFVESAVKPSTDETRKSREPKMPPPARAATVGTVPRKTFDRPRMPTSTGAPLSGLVSDRGVGGDIHQKKGIEIMIRDKDGLPTIVVTKYTSVDELVWAVTRKAKESG